MTTGNHKFAFIKIYLLKFTDEYHIQWHFDIIYIYVIIITPSECYSTFNLQVKFLFLFSPVKLIEKGFLPVYMLDYATYGNRKLYCENEYIDNCTEWIG